MMYQWLDLERLLLQDCLLGRFFSEAIISPYY